MEYKNSFSLGVSATDISVIFNANKWMTPIQLFQFKTGRSEKDDKMSDAAFWGIQLEPVILDHFRNNHPRWMVIHNGSLHEDWRGIRSISSCAGIQMATPGQTLARGLSLR